MFGRSFRIGRIAGIPVGINPWWLAIVALFTWELGVSYYPSLVPHLAPAAAYGLGLASVLLLFASVLAHEFGHAIVARRRGVEVEEIDLWLLGGVSRMRGRPKSPEDEQSYALAGPAVTAVIAAVFAVLAFLLPGSVHSPGKALVEYQFEMNVVLLVFNLLPAFPLDGGRIARAVLWRRRGDLVSATETAANVGRACGFAMLGLGVLLTFGGWAIGLWLAFIGLFIVVAARAERLQEEVVAAFTGLSVTAVMSAPAVCIAAEMTLGDARPYFSRHRYSAFPVIDAEGRAVGLLSIEQLERATAAQLYQALVRERADRDPHLMVPADTDVAVLLETAAFARTGHAVVVDAQRRPLGVVSGTDIERAVRASRLSGGANRRAG